MEKATATRTRLIKLPPFEYVHILDRNTNVTRLEVGPCSLLCREHERLVLGPSKMIVVPPRHYIEIKNPVLRENDDSPPIGKSELDPDANVSDSDFEQGKDDFESVIDPSVFLDMQVPESSRSPAKRDEFGQARLRHGESEIRFEQSDPFPLHPGEEIVDSGLKRLKLVPADTALKLRAKRDFVDMTVFIVTKTKKGEKKALGKFRGAGSEWLYPGPSTYLPQVSASEVESREATVIKSDQRLRLRALRGCITRTGEKRFAGEEWLLPSSFQGAYLPTVDEEVVGLVDPVVLTPKKALKLRAKWTFSDPLSRTKRNAGDEWLVTADNEQTDESAGSSTHVPSPEEEVLGTQDLCTLTRSQYCIISNPARHIASQEERSGITLSLGKKKLITGEKQFFLQPGESLHLRGNIFVLGEDEALIARKLRNDTLEDSFEADERGRRISKHPKFDKIVAGEKFVIRGPREYLPPLTVEVLERRQAVLQLENFGVYAFFWRKVPLHKASDPPIYQ